MNVIDLVAQLNRNSSRIRTRDVQHFSHSSSPLDHAC